MTVFFYDYWSEREESPMMRVSEEFGDGGGIFIRRVWEEDVTRVVLVLRSMRILER